MGKSRSLRYYVTNVISFANSRSKNKYRDRSFEYFAGRPSKELVNIMIDLWAPVVGQDKEIAVIRAVRPKGSRRLGISLEGSTTEPSASTAAMPSLLDDTSEGETAPSRHFIHSIIPGSPFSDLGCLKQGDEILQVNGYRIHGSSHIEAVRCLRCVPSHIELVIARSRDPQEFPTRDLVPVDDVDKANALYVAASEVGSVMTGGVDDRASDSGSGTSTWTSSSRGPRLSLPGQPSNLLVSQWINNSQTNIRAPVEHGLADRSYDAESILSSSPSSRSMANSLSTSDVQFSSMRRGWLATSPAFGNRDMRPSWSKVPIVVMLRRDTSKYGFSISEYKEFSVSETSVSSAELKRRASTLTRRRTVAGELDANPPRFHTLQRSQSTASATLKRPRNKGIILIDNIVPGGCADLDGRLAVGDRLLFINDRKLTRASLGEAVTVLQNAPLGYTMVGVSKMRLVPVESRVPAVWESTPQFAALVTSSTEEEDQDQLALQDEFAKEYVKDHPLDFYSFASSYADEATYHSAHLKVPQMSATLERIVHVKIENSPIGVELDAVAAGGVDGCRVVRVLRGGAVEKTAALVPGDYITRINSHSLCNLSNLEAFRILHRLSADCSTIEVAFYPKEEVIRHRAECVQSDTVNKNNNNGNLSPFECRNNNDIPSPDLIITTSPLLLQSPVDHTGWMQTREIRLLKLPSEATWGLSITGPDVWNDVDGRVELPELPPEISKPVFLSSLTVNTAAARCGLLNLGDIIIGVNGMDATRVGCRMVAEWIQKANLVSASSSASENENIETSEWAFLYLLVLPLQPSLQLPARKSLTGLQSIPPVSLSSDYASISDGNVENDSQPISFLGTTATLVRSAFVSSNDSSSLEEPSSVASLEQHGDLPEPLAHANLSISAPRGQEVNSLRGRGLSSTEMPTPIPSAQTAESQFAWRNIGSSQLTASLAQLTETYRRAAIPGDEIHVVTITPPTVATAVAGSPADATADCETTLGIRLVGHRDTDMRGVFICSLREGSVADQTPGLQVADEIVQVNNVCVMGLTHVSAKLLISKQSELARRSGEGSKQICLVIRHNMVYNSNVMAKPSSTPRIPCGHFLHHTVLRANSHLAAEPSASPCFASTTDGVRAGRPEYDFFDVTIQRNASGGFGLCLVNLNPKRETGIFVQPQDPAGAATSIKIWDRIVAVDGEAVEDYDKTVVRLTQCGPTARLRLARQKPPPTHQLGTISEGSASCPIKLPQSFSPHANPTPILRGVETTVELLRIAQQELGFTIVDGSDTLTEGVFIQEITKNGSVERDGRLKEGDRILAVDDIDLRQSNRAHATKILREAKERVYLTVVRGQTSPACGSSIASPNTFLSSDTMQTHKVFLYKSPNHNYGLVCGDAANDAFLGFGGVVVRAIISASPASKAASLLQIGDMILEVDGLDVHKASSEDVIALLKQRPTHVSLKIGRPKSSAPGRPALCPRLFTVILTRPAGNEARGMSGSVSSPAMHNLLQRQEDSVFGLVLRVATSEDLRNAPGNFIVDHIIPGSAASRSSMIQVGDRLFSISREPVGWLTVEEIRQFTQTFDSLSFELGRLPPISLRQSVHSPSLHHNSESRLDTVKEEEQLPPSDLIVKSFQSPTTTSTNGVGDDPNDFLEVGEEEETTSTGVNIRQIQLPLASAAAASANALGLSIAPAKAASCGQYVCDLALGSPAAMSGLQLGDCILGLDDRLLISLGGHDSSKVLRAIEEAWRSRVQGSDAPRVTLTVIRTAPSQPPKLPQSCSKKSPGFPKLALLPAVVAAAVPTGLQHGERRYSRDIGDSLDVQLQPPPPGLLTEAMYPEAVNGTANGELFEDGGVYDRPDDTLFTPPATAPFVDPSPLENAPFCLTVAHFSDDPVEDRYDSVEPTDFPNSPEPPLPYAFPDSNDNSEALGFLPEE